MPASIVLATCSSSYSSAGPSLVGNVASNALNERANSAFYASEDELPRPSRLKYDDIPGGYNFRHDAVKEIARSEGENIAFGAKSRVSNKDGN